MPGTIRDDKGANSKVLGELIDAGGYLNAGAPQLVKIGRTKNHFSKEIHQPATRFKDSFLRKTVIAFLAIAASIGLSNKVNATYIDLDCTNPVYDECGGAFRTCDLDAFADGVCAGGPRRTITSWYSHFNTGDYIDERWYYYLDEGQYYYLDRAQYKLLGGANYVLGHPCYPKLYERRSDQGIGFTNRGGIYWLGGGLRTFQFVGKSVRLSNRIGYPFDNAGVGCGGSEPISNYVIWGCCFNTGDNIEKWRYYYLDKGRYYALDETQYKWLGGMAYLFESTRYRGWYAYGFPWGYGLICSMEENLRAKIPCYRGEPAIPEPASALLMTLGAIIITLYRRRR